LQIKATFQAVVDALIPCTPELSSQYGEYMVPGAVQGGVDQFLVWQFDHAVELNVGVSLQPVLLSGAIAQMLNSAASQLICAGILRTHRDNYFPVGNEFSSLSRSDRLLTLSYLEGLRLDLGCLPIPFRYNGNWVQIVVDLINRFTMFGYYSEWSGYGSTRLLTPEARRLEYFPFSWTQISYPGPSLS
jgi:hypothetical protein